MNHIEIIEFVRNAIIKSHSTEHNIETIKTRISELKNDDSIGEFFNSDISYLLGPYLTKEMNHDIIISWCDSINDIVNNYNKLFGYLVSPN